MFRFFLFAAIAFVAYAACPNQCSGEFVNHARPLYGRIAARSCRVHNAHAHATFSLSPPPPPPYPAHSREGHGWCDENERCVCFRAPGTANQNAAYAGADCSQRVCPYGRSHDIVSTPSTMFHATSCDMPLLTTPSSPLPVFLILRSLTPSQSSCLNQLIRTTSTSALTARARRPSKRSSTAVFCSRKISALTCALFPLLRRH